MAKIKKTSPLLNLTSFQTFLVDTNPLSEYFKISELSDLLTSGKNGFLIEGSIHLKPSTEVKIEILDTEGNPLYVEPGNGIPEYYEGLSKLISVHVYQDTPIGIGKITILGELETYVDDNGFVQPVPDDWKGVYNVKWERDIKINKNIPNESRIRFSRRPQVIIEELNESFYSRDLTTDTQTNGTVRGIALTPTEGTTYKGYRGGIKYLIQNESVDFVDGASRISITGTSLQDIEILEYLNQRTLIIQIPYTDDNGIISNFSGKSYTLTYQYNSNPVASSILGSFGRFEINYLQTFVGDVERIKVFKKSRSSNVDYEVIQDTRVGSYELLTSIVSGSNINIGYFSSSYEGGKNWNNFWVTQSNAGNILDSSKIYRAVKLQNNRLSSNIGNDIRLESGSEYTLEFYNYYDTSSNDKLDTLKVYLTSTEQSGSGIANYVLTQSIDILSGSNERRSANKVSYNFYPSITDNWTLHFESNNTTPNSYWHVGSIGLQASHEPGFSPDEFQFIIPVNRNLERETFDFKFEFFDINNNYVPITTTYPQTFQSGNIGLIDKNIIIDVDKQFFNFSSSLEGYPTDQQISITGTKNRILGNLLITSQAFDTGGYEIPTGSNSLNPYYAAGKVYPGALHNYGENLYSLSGSLTIADFTGSLHNHPSQSGDIIVDRITYTLTEVESSQPFIKRFTINRLVAGASGVDGINAKILSVSTNTNQFIYEPTGPSLKPIGQTIIFSVKKQNLISGSLTYSKTAGAPPLQLLSTDIDGITTYQLTGSAYAYSLGEMSYYFTGSDEFSNEYYDLVKITPVMNFDGVSVVLTNEATSFPASSSGVVNSGYLSLGNGSVSVRVGSNIIPFVDGNASANSFDIQSVVGTNCTPISTSPSTNSYGISAIDANSDSASLNLTIKYLAGDNQTSASFSKLVSYSKAKKAAPVLELSIANNNQSSDAKSTGVQITPFQTASLLVREIYDGSTNIRSLSGAIIIASSSGLYTGITSNTPNTINLPNLPSNLDSVEVYVTRSVSDSEGSTRYVYGGISLTKVKKAAPSVLLTATPQTQTVAATSQSVQTGTLQTVALEALEGTSSVFNSASILSSNFTGASISTKTLTLGTIANGVPAASASIGINYTDSEGTSASKTINVSAVKAIAGVTGASGSAGAPGSNGTNGLRTAAGMVHYQLTSTTAPSGPTATSYTFSDGTFSGLTTNWGTGAPTYASGNSNKYWYATYTAVETSAGSGVGSVTFGTPTQAIGFSGLVSFTAANNVSDGSNTLSFGVAGTTLINGSNISTGKIISTNYSAGTPYTTAGTILDLDNGRFATKTFYVDSSGNGGFKGTLEAANGSFTGTLVAAGGTFSGDVTAAGGKIGGWTIDSSSIYVPSAISLNSSAKTITIADTSGVPRVNFNTNSSLSSRSVGSPTTVSGTSANNTGTFNPGNFDRTLGTMVSVLNRTYNITTTFTEANGTTALTITSGTPNTIDVWSQILLNDGVTTSVVAEYKDGITFGSSVTWAAINGKVVSLSLLGNGNTWTIYQRFKWTYQGMTYFSANLYNQPAVSVTLAGANSFVEVIAGGVQVSRDASTYVVMDRAAGSGTMLEVGGAITATGNITAYSSSDKRLKENITPIENALDKIDKIDGVEFDWTDEFIDKESGGKGEDDFHFRKHDVGVIAQEIQSVLPEVVAKRPDGYLAVRYEKIVPLLIQSIKELKTQIEELKKNR